MKERIIAKYSRFLGEVLVIFSVTILFVSIIGSIWGDEIQNYSTMFLLGKKGISYITLLQFFIVSFLITLVKSFFISERYLKKRTTLQRIILMLFSIVLIMVVSISGFGWFPINSLSGWIGFILSFGGCFACGTMIKIVRLEQENEKYEKLLLEYKKKKNSE
jgi:magnesium-transporting ATPase (P-type)